MPRTEGVLSRRQALVKRAFDVAVAGPALVVLSPLIGLAWLAARLETRQSGIYRQLRVGKDGELFEVLKLRTMRDGPGGTVTRAGDPRITRSGAVLRRSKLDELPQLVNVIRGEMSLVGPRPDVPGFADRLAGGDEVILRVRPGITSPAALAFRNEEELLAGQSDPTRYNREVIWPEKVRINRRYVTEWTFRADVRCLLRTARRRRSPRDLPVGGSASDG